MNSTPFRYEVASLSDPGKIRTLNEDGAAVDDETGFAVVTDGMGGHRAGDLASRLALESIARSFSAAPHACFSPEWVRETVASANKVIHAAALKQPRSTGMGTTLAMAVFHEKQAIFAHVGDSRIYRLRNSRLELLTRDDSVLNDQVEMGLIAA